MSNLISIFLLIASVGIYFGYISPTYGKVTMEQDLKARSITELREERDRYVDALSKTREIEQVRTGLLDKYNKIPQKNREDLEKLLPDHIDSVRLIIDINNIASEYGMTLKNISLTESESPKGKAGAPAVAIGPQNKLFQSVALKFNVSGPYESFRDFLTNLEKSLRLVDVTALAFNTDEAIGGDFAVTLSAYRLIFNKNEHF
ncbi:MAG: hypothetical protein Q7R64_01605 [bacterium]|nr:hypothetical protein [bacterium]